MRNTVENVITAFKVNFGCRLKFEKTPSSVELERNLPMILFVLLVNVYFESKCYFESEAYLGPCQSMIKFTATDIRFSWGVISQGV